MQRYVNDVKADISREMELDELRKLQTSMQDAARSFEQSVTREVNAAESELQKIAQEANPTELPRPAGGSAPPSRFNTATPTRPDSSRPLRRRRSWSSSSVRPPRPARSALEPARPRAPA